MSRLTDWVTVIPPRGQVKETARALLAVADHPGLVRTLGTGDEFLVHPDVADRFSTPKPRRARAKKEGS